MEIISVVVTFAHVEVLEANKKFLSLTFSQIGGSEFQMLLLSHGLLPMFCAWNLGSTALASF